MKLHSRFALISTGMTFVVGLVFLGLMLLSNHRYHQEVTQNLHRDLAQYIIEHLPYELFTPEGQVDQKVLKSIAMNTMMINPSVEVYLLDSEGNVLGHALPEADIEGGRIDIDPVHQFLETQNRGAVLGDNPRHMGQQNIFSATPVSWNDEMMGYLYVVLDSHMATSIANQFSMNHTLRTTAFGLLVLFVLFVLFSTLIFKRVARPLRDLMQKVRSYRSQTLNNTSHEIQASHEIDELADSIELMQSRIQEQFDRLGENDRMRRELISNVSHDLRTPLASMQGYLETLLIKADLSEEDKRNYLEVAYRHSRHLNHLISQLFELSKLDAGQIEVSWETFSISELLHDLSQDYALTCGDKGLRIAVEAPSDDILVHADIALIHRVFRNLIDNAIRFTPTGGEIKLILQPDDDQVCIHVQDTGQGINEKEAPYIFERFYQPNLTQPGIGNGGAGLGLNIVKKILELHNSIISVDSSPDRGARFSFALAPA